MDSILALPGDVMKIVVLGASGRVGHLVVQRAVARGHQVTAFLRHDPGNIHLNGAIGQDAVVYAIGVKSTGPTTLFSQSTRLLIGVMEQQGVRRLVCITGVGAGETKGHGGFLYDHVIFPLFTKNRYADKERQEELIRQSRLDWPIKENIIYRAQQVKQRLSGEDRALPHE